MTAPRLSVLERLVDAEPEFRDPEDQPDYEQALSTLEQSVLRDLQWLLNARAPVPPEPEAEGRVDDDPRAGTVVLLGLPDLTSLDLKHDADRDYLKRRIAAAIRRFEPRLDHVAVSTPEGPAGAGRTRYQVSARLNVDPEPVRLLFDATVVWRSRQVEVR
jgi:type VI secretion system lysozyme-like protein